MRRVLMAGLAALLAVGATAKPASACPECPLGWCVGWPSGPWKFCIQLENGCILLGGDWCDETESLNASTLSPDGSVAMALTSSVKVLAFEARTSRVLAQYSVVGCQHYVVSRTYEVGEAAARRERTSVILI